MIVSKNFLSSLFKSKFYFFLLRIVLNKLLFFFYFSLCIINLRLLNFNKIFLLSYQYLIPIYNSYISINKEGLNSSSLKVDK